MCGSVLFSLHLFNSHPWWNFQRGGHLGVSTHASAWMLSPRQVWKEGVRSPSRVPVRQSVSLSLLFLTPADPKPPLHP